MHNPTL